MPSFHFLFTNIPRGVAGWCAIGPRTNRRRGVTPPALSPGTPPDLLGNPLDRHLPAVGDEHRACLLRKRGAWSYTVAGFARAAETVAKNAARQDGNGARGPSTWITFPVFDEMRAFSGEPAVRSSAVSNPVNHQSA